MGKCVATFCILSVWCFLAFSSKTLGENPKIYHLFPSFAVDFYIHPALPEDFVSKRLDEEEDFCGEVVWGKEDDLALLLQHPEKIERTYIYVELSGSMVQEDLQTFKGEETLQEAFEGRGFTSIQFSKLFWGPYPVIAAEMTSLEGRKEFTAWAGLNAEGGWVAMFHFIYPTFAQEPTAEQLQIWHTFLTQTTPYGL